MISKIFNMESNSRLAYFDNIKFLMIVLMFVGHFVDRFTSDAVAFGAVCKSTYLFVYAFHMPILLFVSGLFYSQKNWKRKVLFYACCGFALKIFITISDIVFRNEFTFKLLADKRIPWFMFVLAAYQIIMRLLNMLNDRYKGILLALFLLLGCVVGLDKSIHDYLYLSRIVVFFPVFFAGTMLKPEKIQDFFQKHFKKLLIPAVLILAVWFFLSFFRVDEFYALRQFFTGRHAFPEGIRTVGPLIRLGSYAITFFTGASVMVLIPKRRLPVISTLGTHTLNVYFWHWTFIMVLVKGLHLHDFFLAGVPQKIICFLIPIVFSFVFLGVKLFNYPLQWLKKAIYS